MLLKAVDRAWIGFWIPEQDRPVYSLVILEFEGFYDFRVALDHCAESHVAASQTQRLGGYHHVLAGERAAYRIISWAYDENDDWCVVVDYVFGFVHRIVDACGHFVEFGGGFFHAFGGVFPEWKRGLEEFLLEFWVLDDDEPPGLSACHGRERCLIASFDNRVDDVSRDGF